MSEQNNKFTHCDSITLKEHFNTKLEALKDKVELNFKLNQVALDKAEEKNDIRLAGMNEFRAAMSDQSKNFLTKSEYKSEHKNIEDKIESLELTRAELKGKANQSTVILTTIIAIVGIIISIISCIINFL